MGPADGVSLSCSIRSLSSSSSSMSSGPPSRTLKNSTKRCRELTTGLDTRSHSGLTSTFSPVSSTSSHPSSDTTSPCRLPEPRALFQFPALCSGSLPLASRPIGLNSTVPPGSSSSSVSGRSLPSWVDEEVTVSGSRGTPTVPAGRRGLQGLMMTSLGLSPWSDPGTGEGKRIIVCNVCRHVSFQNASFLSVLCVCGQLHEHFQNRQKRSERVIARPLMDVAVCHPKSPLPVWLQCIVT